MPCYSPLQGFRGRGGVLVFKKADAVGFPLEVPCGQCIGCRLERSRQWAVRCMHEAQLYDENCFVTLTYSPENLPVHGSLVKSHYQDFMKRLRSRIFPRRVRFFQCGEYGEEFDRPHYHALLFGFDFSDKKFFKTVNSERLYTSELLEDVWSYGFCTVGSVTFESAAYVARYCVKKMNGEKAFHHYMKLDERTGELHQVEPEYCTMSRGGSVKGSHGIGAGWFDTFQSDVFPCDELVVRGHVTKPPRYYDKMFDLSDADAMLLVKQRRKAQAKRRASDNTPERLGTRKRVKLAQVGMLKRGYENEV